MNIKQNSNLLQIFQKFLPAQIIVGLFLVLLQISVVMANETVIKALDFASLGGDKVQLQLEMDGAAVMPKVFQTDNPARIALDFTDVKSGLDKKSFSVNKGAASSVYVVEVAGRTRVVINLLQSVPYQTRIDGNKLFVTLNEVSTVSSEVKDTVKTEPVPEQVTEKVAPEMAKKHSVVTRLLPKQLIKDIDFKRGATGNGLLLIALAKPNTIVDTKEKGGKVVLKFLNTQLPDVLRKRFDVSDFATPVQKIDAVTAGEDTVLTISTADGNYEYSSYQANGLLTVDFRPMTAAEKEVAAKTKFPYSGNKLSLNFQNIPVRDVLQVLADFTEFNMIATDTVGGDITLRLNDVPWDQALDLILKSKGLGQRKAGNVVWIAPTEKITELEKQEEESQKVSVRLEPLKTEYIQINYAKAEDIKAMLMGQGQNSLAGTTATTNTNNPSSEIETGKLLSARGIASVDTRTNTLIVKDTVARLDEIRGLIKLLDIPVRQVMIESRIVIATKNFAQNLGVKFGVAQASYIGSGKTFAYGPQSTQSGIVTSDPTSGQYKSGGTFVPEVTSGGSNTGAYLFDLGAKAIGNTAPGALAMTLARAADYVLNLELSALENENKGEVIANPRVMTSDRVEAFISQGVQIPYVTQSSAGGTTTATTSFKRAVLELKVKPQITPNGTIIMELKIKKDEPDLNTGGITTREVETSVQVNDGETIVLGGVYEITATKGINKIPFFGDLPGVGWLFRNNADTDQKRELLVFVTPKIIKEALSAR